MTKSISVKDRRSKSGRCAGNVVRLTPGGLCRVAASGLGRSRGCSIATQKSADGIVSSRRLRSGRAEGQNGSFVEWRGQMEWPTGRQSRGRKATENPVNAGLPGGGTRRSLKGLRRQGRTARVTPVDFRIEGGTGCLQPVSRKRQEVTGANLRMTSCGCASLIASNQGHPWSRHNQTEQRILHGPRM